MTAPTVAAFGAYGADGAIPVPSGVSSGNIVVAFVYGWWGGNIEAAFNANPAAAFTPPDGTWTFHAGAAKSFLPSNESMGVGVFWKRATGAMSGNLVFTNATVGGVSPVYDGFGVALRVTGAAPSGSPFRSGIHWLASDNSGPALTALQVAGWTPAGDESLLLAAIQVEPGARTITAGPSGWTPVTSTSGSPVGGRNAVYSDDQTTAEATGNLLWTFSESAALAMVAAVEMRPDEPTPLATPVVTVTLETDPTSGSNGAIRVTWPAVSGAVRYRAGIASGHGATSGFTVTSENAASPYNFTGLAPGNYTVAIQARPDSV